MRGGLWVSAQADIVATRPEMRFQSPAPPPDMEQPPPKHLRASREAGKVSRAGLLHVHLGASLFELGLGGVGFVLRDALLDRLRSGIHQLLGLLQAQAR